LAKSLLRLRQPKYIWKKSANYWWHSGTIESKLGTLSYRRNLTEDLAIFRVSPADKSHVSNFSAGQYVSLGLPVETESGIETTYRAFSVASPPEELHYFEFYVKKAKEPVKGLFTTALFDLSIGSEIYWTAPSGNFTIEGTLPDGSADVRRLILIAAGTGLAPFVSYLKHLHYIQSKRQIVLVHGARYPTELGYKEEFESLTSDSEFNFVYIPTISRIADPQSAGWSGTKGRVEDLLQESEERSYLDVVLLEQILPSNSFVHVCGYPGTIDSVMTALTRRGFVSNRASSVPGSFSVKVEVY
jgi:ferredoxin/flavodoxin---NADP+ reductase